MKESLIMMGMPITIEIVDADARASSIRKVISYFHYVDEKFSTYKTTSEISKINRGEIAEADYSDDMRQVFLLSDQTREETGGYFDIRTAQKGYDPSGLVKGWAIWNAAQILKKDGCANFYVDVGGDIQVFGKNKDILPWSIGIRNPFDRSQIVKTVRLGKNEGIATSGTYVRGEHIYDPLHQHAPANAIMSLTVIGKNIYEADRFATAAFAMGEQGIFFIERLKGFEGYMIDKNGIGTETSGFRRFIAS